MATPAEKARDSAELTSVTIYGYQTKMASQALTDAIGDLAKRGCKGEELQKQSIALAIALHDGLIQINQSSKASCSNSTAPYEQQQSLGQLAPQDPRQEGDWQS
ncbi:hypothetical protein QT231_24055 [Halomonas sp. SpR1]|uniref:hypothetical protein n=1 Tax=Halomonas sp. SpR1 TaxID=3050462 RepID=UPI0027E3E230|nr:hypothetical protein [Halomonas sp. SpR1]MDQ7735778.1 hypothetical protein [Halomonas sp. SpR1]